MVQLSPGSVVYYHGCVVYVPGGHVHGHALKMQVS